MASVTSSLCIFLIVILSAFINDVSASSKVRLRDIETLTLYEGRMTTGRRASPIPQLSCVGGTAKCSFKPSTVQCYNKGFDGSDVQWECKASMDKQYTFGGVEVICEGYDYPDDPYILKGSCGLEYTINYASDSHRDQSSYYGNSHNNYFGSTNKKSTKLGDFIILIVVAIIIYALYKTCISNRQYSPTSDDYPADDPYQSGTGSFGSSGYGTAPPPGFRSNSYNDGSCGSSSRTYQRGTGSGAGGFWTGAAAGGLLGYMFGNRGGGNYYGSGRSYYGGGQSSGSSWGSSSGGFGGGSSTSSGFGGTRRR